MNLMFTVAFKPTKVRGAHILGLAFARAIVAEIEDRTSLTATIKWPNDVYCKGKKIAGVLTETVFSGNRLDRLLIGVGFNVNQTEFNDALQQKASSLHLLTQTEFSRERVLCAVLQRLEYDYRRWHTADETLLPYINKKIQGYGQWLHLHVDGKQTAEKHKLLGVNEQGELTILSAAGDLKTYSYEQIRPLTG